MLFFSQVIINSNLINFLYIDNTEDAQYSKSDESSMSIDSLERNEKSDLLGTELKQYRISDIPGVDPAVTQYFDD